jgi:hypothetical protein
MKSVDGGVRPSASEVAAYARRDPERAIVGVSRRSRLRFDSAASPRQSHLRDPRKIPYGSKEDLSDEVRLHQQAKR